MALKSVVQAVVIVVLALTPRASIATPKHALDGTADLLLQLPTHPFAIAHRGFGENPGTDPSRPIENTVAAVREGFRAGVSVVEVDVVLTRDARVVAFHDDVLRDGTCVHHLSLAELRVRLPHVPELAEVLAVARTFNQGSAPLRGIVIVELKAAAPRCDPNDTRDHAIVAAVTHVIRKTQMTRQVLLTSLSPTLLFLARQHAPDIERILTVSGLQFLTEREIEDALDMPVTLVDKRLDLGLQWAELGDVFRLPGYRSFEELLRTAALTGVRVVEADLLLLHSAGRALVDVLHASGLEVFGFTALTDRDWDFLESLGVDGIYTDDVGMGVRRQAPIP